ncbi:MAG: prepilin-type N-terminal cleavage/methylation domain-containing protein [Sedimentisphaerales bacterium]|nr:prepilin-type N-terminal cleavage/methylation domain-containing protein [Sedimentisphaerales bacterium]
MKTRQIRKSVGNMKYNHSNDNVFPAAFTLIEIMMVVVILAIAAMIAVPFAVSGAGTQLKAAANIIASDLEYAKSMAITTGKWYSVVFDTALESYRIEDDNDVVINHPVKKGFKYEIKFASDSRLSKVNIDTAVFDTGTTVKFDYLGSPYSSTGALNSGTVTLSAGGGVMYVNVEPVTGYITITD